MKKRAHKILLRLLLSIVCLMPSLGWAWGVVGHKLIADIAYAQLTPQAREKVDRLSLLLINTGSPLQRFEYIAAEPDFIDRADGSLYSPKAHFIAFPYIKDGVMASPISVPNLLTGLRDTSNQLNHAYVNNTDAANALSHFVHYVGDAHQPLHCIRLYSTRFPRGDYGGQCICYSLFISH